MVQLATLKNLSAADTTGQKFVRLQEVPLTFTIGEMTDDLLPRMRLNQVDHAGNPVRYQLHLEREARHLHSSELVGEALQEADHLVLHPRIVAG